LADDDYRRASFEVWEAMAAGWDSSRRWVWEVSRTVGEWLVEALDPQPGETILELAAGLGDTGFAAAARIGGQGRLITTDLSARMVDAARRHAAELGVTNAEFRQLEAERMELDDASVDGLLCRWGYMLMAHPAAALHESRRVLRHGGRLAFSVWASPERNPWATVAGRALLEQTGAPPPDPEAPGLFALAREDRVRALLRGAGLEPRRIEEVEMYWRFGSSDEYWRFVSDMAGTLAMVIRGLPGSDRAAVRERIERELEPHAAEDGTYELKGTCLNVLAI
jgi:SAM-dependent methyltransferase